MRIESSIITSLSELRAIEQQRIAEERAAIERDRVAMIEAARAAEQAKIDAEQARIRADREERMRIETARLEAEREVRLRIEAHEAGERARLAAQLEEGRLAQEMELRRAEVAKKRPTWMLVVTGVAAAAAVGLTLFAIDRSQDMARAKEQQQQAIAEKDRAKEELRQSGVRLAALQAEVAKFDDELTRLQQQLIDAQSAEDRRRLAGEVAAARQRKIDADKRLKAEADRKWREERAGGVDVGDCVNTPLGCLDTRKSK